MSILEKKYQQVQRDFLSAKDDNERLENELNSKESSFLQVRIIYKSPLVVQKHSPFLEWMLLVQLYDVPYSIK